MAEGQATVPILEVRDVVKAYGPVHALRGISMKVEPGEVVGLLGDNGAGKSTLVRIISGLTAPDSGTVLVGGNQVDISTPQVAKDLGIETVHQDLMLVGGLDVAANMFLSREIRSARPVLRRLGWLDKAAMHRETSTILDRLHIRIPSTRSRVELLSGGQRQSIAVGRAVSWGRRLVIMDEPVAALGVEQSRMVLDLIGELRANSIGVLLISHNMHHVMQVCDRAIVILHGRSVADVQTRAVSAAELEDMITGAAFSAADATAARVHGG